MSGRELIFSKAFSREWATRFIAASVSASLMTSLDIGTETVDIAGDVGTVTKAASSAITEAAQGGGAVATNASIAIEGILGSRICDIGSWERAVMGSVKGTVDMISSLFMPLGSRSLI